MTIAWSKLETGAPVKTGSGHVTRVVADIIAQLIAKLSEQAASEVTTDQSSINLK